MRAQMLLRHVTLAALCTAAMPFNLSPRPNLVLREPRVDASQAPLDRSSYFGFSINLRSNSILIGAPRANSTLPDQLSIPEPGVIYRCPLASPLTSASCAPFVFEAGANKLGTYDKYAFNGEWRDNQWLGAAMDGGSAESDRFVVCAPRMHSHEEFGGITFEKNSGVCYWTTDTTAEQPADVQKINGLVAKGNRLVRDNNEDVYFHMLGEQGLSVHVTDDGSEIVVGAPGVFNWRGSVVRYGEVHNSGGGIAKRDLHHPTARQSHQAEYEETVPNPRQWLHEDGSYFGYAVASAPAFLGPYAKQKTLYVASAPQANNQQGEVYVFDIVDVNDSKGIKEYARVRAGQMGEYFGYALAVDDFNADGWTDLVVAAPFYSKDEDSYENGAVYVYDNMAGNLVLAARLQSEYPRNGRFGATVARLGDVNQDGFNDLAVGAPYEDDGAVYIYLGSATGLGVKPSQRLSAPSTPVDIVAQPPIFGHGLSKGADMDGNQYPDLAVGAPNAETVYIYRAYPVAQISASVVPTTNEIAITDTYLDFRACWKLSTTAAPLLRNPSLEFEIKLDQGHGRITTTDAMARNFIKFQAVAEAREQCREYRVNVRYVPHEVYRALQLDMHFEVRREDRVPTESEEFCEHCVAVDPRQPRMAQAKVVFSTGCKKTPCEADLQLSSVVHEPLPYIIGSTTSLVIEYTIENAGETAFLPELNITAPAHVKFTKIPTACRLGTGSMICDLSAGGYKPLKNSESTTMRIHLDTTQLGAAGNAGELVVLARVKSSGNESNDADNEKRLVIALREFSTMELTGRSTVESVTLDKGLGVLNVTHSLELRNAGPSDMTSITVVVRMPRVYINPWTSERTELYEMNRSMISGTYDNRLIEPEFSLIVAGHEQIVESMESIETVVENNPHNTQSNLHRRRRRQAAYQPTDTTGAIASPIIKRHTLLDSEELSYLPPNRTILFNCDDESAECVHVRFVVPNFRAGSQSSLLRIRLNMSIDLGLINGIVDDVHDIFVLQTLANVQRLGDEAGETVSMVPKYPHTVISKYAVDTVPIWVYILSALGGLLILVGITYAMHRAGFFQREQKMEMEQLKRKSQALSLQREEAADE